jgi:hypothetical protein
MIKYRQAAERGYLYSLSLSVFAEIIAIILVLLRDMTRKLLMKSILAFVIAVSGRLFCLKLYDYF